MQSSKTMLIMAAVIGLSAGTLAQASPPAPSLSQQAEPASAASGNESALPSFDELDKQHHGVLSRSDIPKDIPGLKSLRSHFAESDTDHNGRLSPGEYAAYVQNQRPASEKPQGN